MKVKILGYVIGSEYAKGIMKKFAVHQKLLSTMYQITQEKMNELDYGFNEWWHSYYDPR